MTKKKSVKKSMRILFLSLLFCLFCMNVAVFAEQSTQFNLYVEADKSDDSDKNKDDPNKDDSKKDDKNDSSKKDDDSDSSKKDDKSDSVKKDDNADSTKKDDAKNPAGSEKKTTDNTANTTNTGSTAKTANTSVDAATSVKTGEEGGQALYIALAVLASGAIVLVYRGNKERQRKH